MLRHFAWSKKVQAGVERTIKALGLQTSREGTLENVLAIHVRRGDYERHCSRLAGRNEGFVGFGLMKGVKDALGAHAVAFEPETHTHAKRWWYWAGRAGQRPSQSAGAASSTSVSYSEKQRYNKYHSRPTIWDPTLADGGLGKTGRVKWMKEDFDFGKGGAGGERGRLRVQDGVEWGEIVLVPPENTKDEVVPDVEVQKEEAQVVEKVDVKAKGKKKEKGEMKNAGKPGGQRGWGWWGNGAKKGKARGNVRAKKVRRSVIEASEGRLEARYYRNDDDEALVLAPAPGGEGSKDVPSQETKRETAEEMRAREEADKVYMRRCLPGVEDIVKRADEVRADWNGSLQSSNTTANPLTKVLLISNGWPSFVSSISSALRALNTNGETWAEVHTSRVRPPAVWEKDVEVAVDMALAERAEVFLGNGFSTLSANVGLLRVRRWMEMSGAVTVGEAEGEGWANAWRFF